MMLANLVLSTALVGATVPVESGVSCPNQGVKIQRFIEAHLARYRYGSRRYRRTLSTQLSTRIMVEAKRWRLDPLVMTTIAWIESDFRPHVRGTYGGTSGRGRRMNEVGVWQLIPWDHAVLQAARFVTGCKPSTTMNRWQRARWRRVYRGKQCLFPDIGAARLRSGYFVRAELRGIVIGTYVAAYEMRSHIDACRKRNPSGHKWYAPRWLAGWKRANPNVNVTALERYLHYNWGGKQYPRNHYREKLFKRYSKVRRGVCGP